MNYSQLIQSIKKRSYMPVYFFHGDEGFFMDSLSSLIEKSVLSEEEKEFNQVILYGKEVDGKQVSDHAGQFPMMASYRVVIIREAQDMHDIKSLIPYLNKPSEKTILVVNYKYKKVRAKSELWKSINKQGFLFEAKKLYDNQVPAWISSHSSNYGLNLKQEAATAMAELLGSDLSKIDKELEKLSVVLPKDKIVDMDAINQYIGMSKEFNVFELNNAIGEKDVVKANRIIDYFAANPKSAHATQVISTLSNYFMRVWIVHENMKENDQALSRMLKMGTSFFLKQYRAAARNYSRQKLMQVFEILSEYDLKIKGVGNRTTNAGELLKELIFKILH